MFKVNPYLIMLMMSCCCTLLVQRLSAAPQCPTDAAYIEGFEVVGAVSKAELEPFVSDELDRCVYAADLPSVNDDVELRIRECGLYETVHVSLRKGTAPGAFALRIDITPRNLTYVGSATRWYRSSRYARIDNGWDDLSLLKESVFVGHPNLPYLGSAVDLAVGKEWRHSFDNEGQDTDNTEMHNISLNVTQPRFFNDHIFSNLAVNYFRIKEYAKEYFGDFDRSAQLSFYKLGLGWRQGFWMIAAEARWIRAYSFSESDGPGKNGTRAHTHEETYFWYETQSLLLAYRSKLLIAPLDEGLYAGIKFGHMSGQHGIADATLFGEYSWMPAYEILLTPRFEYKVEIYDGGGRRKKEGGLTIAYEVYRNWLLSADVTYKHTRHSSESYYTRYDRMTGLTLKYMHPNLRFEFRVATGSEQDNYFDYDLDPRRVSE